MNELQVALAIIGIIAVVGILIYNRLQERRYRKQTEAGFARPNRDALLDEDVGKVQVNRAWSDQNEPVFNELEPVLDAAQGAREPAFHADDGLTDDAGVADMQPIVPALDDSALEPVAQSASAVSTAQAAGVSAGQSDHVQVQPAQAQSARAPVQDPPHNELIEFRAQLKSLDGIPSEVFSEVLNRCRALGKPVRWRALPLGGLEWEVLQPQSHRRYLEVTASMQLADRNGAASRDELSSLCNMVQETALSNGWQSKCDDLVEAMARALSLDKFCADVDVLIGLNIVARGNATLPTVKIRHEAAALGMRLQADGAYHLLDSRNETLFTLATRDAPAFSADAADDQEIKAMTLLFDVPRVPDGLKTFDTMVALGRKLGHESGGLLVDDNLRPLTDSGIEKIRSQLAQIYDKMEARGIPPGGRLALRLFS